MSTLNAERGLRTSSPLSKHRAVYSIDQILGNHRKNSINGKHYIILPQRGFSGISKQSASHRHFSVANKNQHDIFFYQMMVEKNKYSNDQISMKTCHANKMNFKNS